MVGASLRSITPQVTSRAVSPLSIYGSEEGRMQLLVGKRSRRGDPYRGRTQRRRAVATAAVMAAGVLGVAAAAADAQTPAPYKVLVVTSTTDALTTAGIGAITSAVGTAGTVTAPPPATVGSEFTPAGLDQYRAVVF